MKIKSMKIDWFVRRIANHACICQKIDLPLASFFFKTKKIVERKRICQPFIYYNTKHLPLYYNKENKYKFSAYL